MVNWPRSKVADVAPKSRWRWGARGRVSVVSEGERCAGKQSMATAMILLLVLAVVEDSVGAGSSLEGFYRCDMGWEEVTAADPVI